MSTDSFATSRKLLAGGVILIAGIGALWWVIPSFETWERDLVELIRSWGVWGVVGSIGLMVVHSFLPFPAEMLALANGMVYGPVWGSVVTWTGAMLGAAAAFGLARRLGRPWIKRWMPSRHWERVAAWSEEKGGFTLLVCRLVPVIAFNLLNYAAALTEISWPTFLWATGLGILPLTVALAFAGDEMVSLPAWAWILFGLVAAAAGLIWNRRWQAKVSKRVMAAQDAERRDA